MKVEVRWLNGTYTLYSNVKVLRTITTTMPTTPMPGDLALVAAQVQAIRVLDDKDATGLSNIEMGPLDPRALNTFDGT